MGQTTPAWRVFDEPGATQASSSATVANASPTAGVSLAPPQLLLAAAGLIGALLIGGVAFVVAMGGSEAAIVEGPGATAGAVPSGDG